MRFDMYHFQLTRSLIKDFGQSLDCAILSHECINNSFPSPLGGNVQDATELVEVDADATKGLFDDDEDGGGGGGTAGAGAPDTTIVHEMPDRLVLQYKEEPVKVECRFVKVKSANDRLGGR